MEESVFEDPIHNLILLVGAGGKRVEGSKSLRSTAYLSRMAMNKETFQYSWPINFWGPLSLELNAITETSIRSGFVHRGIDFKEKEPIHHPHSLHTLGLSHFVHMIEKLKTEERKALRNYVPDMIAWLRIPSKYSVSRASFEWRKTLTNGGSSKIDYDKVFSEIRHPMNYFDRGIIEGICDFYKIVGYDTRMDREKGKFVISVAIPGKVCLRYDYLKVNPEQIDHDIEAADIKRQFRRSYSLHVLKEEGIANEKDVRSSLQSVRDEKLTGSAVDDMITYFNDAKKELFDVFEATSVFGKPSLRMIVSRDRSVLDVSDVKKVLREWKPVYYLQFWHILQPYELRDALLAFRLEYLRDRLKYH